MSTDRRFPFPFHQFEPKWQAVWESQKTFRTPGPGDADFDAAKPKFYALDMFPYPSGEGLHVGHPEGYTATDIVSRFKKKSGFNVLHPMGWDAFGLPAEQYAIKTGQHPRATTEKNVANFRKQLKALGFGYDWDREVNTTDPDYFKWTQWIFLQIYNSWFNPATQKAEPISTYTGKDPDSVRLAYVHEAPVNWCPELGTVLSNEEVTDGKSEIGGFPVERRPMKQWMLRITAFADRLAAELEPLDWPEGIKARQRDWIGRSEGAEVTFQIDDNRSVTVFTTRPDTLFGATYMVLAPEHPLVNEISTAGHKEVVVAYQKATSSKSDMDRGLAKDKTGVWTGATAVNPVNGERIPIWISDYVMMGYGTGAIMAVPAHDERDFEFATKFALPIIQVVASKEQGRPAPVQSNYFHPGEEIEKWGQKLPHWSQPGASYFITYRLADSLPNAKLEEWKKERNAWIKEHPEPWDTDTEGEYHREFTDRLDAWLDSGQGSCILKNPDVARIVAENLKHFDGDRYQLGGFVIMPNHVHIAVTLASGEDLDKLMHSWKSFTSKAITRLLGGDGNIWQADYFDRIVRGPRHWDRILSYIAENPVVAKLGEGEFVHFECRGGPPQLLSAIVADGLAINSGFLNGLGTAEAKSKIIAWLVEKGLGQKTVNYKLRDWLFARQRYWGEPFPIVWEDGKHRALSESELPVLPPELADFKPTGTVDPPLSKATEWVAYSATARRELNTMPQWAGSCWYYLRYCDARNKDRFISREAEAYWLGKNGNPGGVDLYVGGTEHAVLHLLYSRFWHKILFDLGHLTTNEPFQKLVNQGLIMGEDGRKMSKSLGNVVNPDHVISEYGADSLRLYEMFMGPLEQVKPWSMKGVEGVHRFLARVWRLVMEENQEGEVTFSSKVQEVTPDAKLNRVVHETIKKVGEDIERMSFNTGISAMMVCTNALVEAPVKPVSCIVSLLHILSPYAPHLAEELFAQIRKHFPKYDQGGTNAGLLSHLPWPKYDPQALVVSEMEIVVQVNGKLRDRITLPVGADQAAHEASALAADKVREVTAGKEIAKIIVVPGRLVNVVVKG